MENKTTPRGVLYKHWMATIFDLSVDPHSWENVKFCVWQKEKCPDTGREHLQLFVSWTKRQRRTALLKLYNGDWRNSRSPKDAIKYCQKHDTRIDGPWTIGTPPVFQGQKFHVILDDIKSGINMKALAEKHPGMYLRYGMNMKRMRHLMTPERTENTQIIWIWGPSGAGKSTYAKKVASAGGRSVYCKDGTTKWWPLYEQQDVVFVDDFKGGLLPSHLFQIGGNSYPLQVEYKGSYTQFDSRQVYITSVKHPSHIYGELTNAWSHGLKRRVKGHTYWMNMQHEVFHTDWVPPFRGCLEPPPMEDCTQVLEEIEFMSQRICLNTQEEERERALLKNISSLCRKSHF